MLQLHLSPTKPLFSPPNLRLNPPALPTPLRIRAIAAAHLKSEHRSSSSSLKIAVFGFGNFGQFLSKTLIRHGHDLITHSRSDHDHDLCEQHPDVVLLSAESVLRSLPFQRLRRSTLSSSDFLSVKEFPKNLFLNHLPEDFDILCTHPMFGPESGKHSWSGLSFVYDRVRIGEGDCRRSERCEKFLRVFENEGCRMVEMSCEEHDKYAAGSQFVTHTMGRVLEKFGVESSPIDTNGYETLLDLVENTSTDSFELYYGLFMYNQNALEQLERLDMAFESIKKDLFGRLHQVYRKQMFGGGEVRSAKKTEQKLLTIGVALPINGSSSPPS